MRVRHKHVLKHCGKFLGQDQISDHVRQCTPSEDSVPSNRRWKNYYSQAGLTRVSATPSKTYWRTRWDQGIEETVTALPERSCSTGGKCFLCISKKLATNTDKAAERLPATEQKECKGKKKIFKSLKWSIFSISNKQGCHSHLWFWPSKWEFLNPEGPQKEQSLWDSCRHDTPYRQEWGGGQLGMWKRRVLAPDSWGACERNEFSESTRLHLPRQARVPAKSHQSCPTLCNHMDCSLPRLLCPWDSPGMNTGVGCHALFSHT